MTNQAFYELLLIIWGFIKDYSWAIFFVSIGIGISVFLGKEMETISEKIVSPKKAEEKYSKKSIENWRIKMEAIWTIGLGALIPCFLIYSVSKYLPKSFLDNYFATIQNSKFLNSQAILLIQAIIFLSMLAIKFHSIFECYKARKLAKDSGL